MCVCSCVSVLCESRFVYIYIYIYILHESLYNIYISYIDCMYTHVLSGNYNISL